jgi:solute carrier family 25 phosphate transporter 3
MSKTEEPWNSRYTGRAVPHDASYYAKCFTAGVLACGPTHAGVTPLDVAKCNMQANPDIYKSGLPGTIRDIVREGGSSAILRGFLPTLMGYSAQGFFKFGLNEVFKDMYSNVLGKDWSHTLRFFVWAGASASAEFFADIALCPLEMVKVKMQTTKLGTFPTSLGPAFAEMRANPEMKFPFGSVVPLWSRQIPYTVMKFVGFEAVVEGFYRWVFTQPKDSYTKPTQLFISFASGYIAGVACAIISQPADNLVSQKGNPAQAHKSWGQLINETGWKNLFLKGLGTRVIMIGTLTGFQWWIYDSFKTACGLGTTGGGGAKKH